MKKTMMSIIKESTEFPRYITWTLKKQASHSASMKWFKSIKKERKRKQFEQVAKPSLKRKEGNIEYLYLNLFKTRNFIQIRRKKYIEGVSNI